MDKKNDKVVRVQPALRTYNVLTSVSRCALVFLLSSATPLVAQTGGDAARGRGDQPPTVAALFSDFLHFSVLGRFDVADTQAQQLLNHSDLDPVELLRLSEEQERGIETLIVLINNSTISQSASRVLEVIREGEHLRRQNSDRILTNIAKLGGDPQTEHNAIQRLVD
ncbi:MAG: hypothetical protein IH859_07105, partial [Chloroflexi bacterium]|nr:hypothetical protein [Chloroflexota bacterium]